MGTLAINDLHVKLADEDKVILDGLSLTVRPGEVHAIMGPNGSGKSTLSYVLAGRAGYEVTGGEVTLDGEDLLAMAPDERAAKGVFLAFQYPIEIPGVATMQFLKVALNAQRKARGEPEMSTPDFMRLIRERALRLGISPEMLKRPVNVGFSGGEKKRAEILQMAVLEPSLCIMDETNSGLDIDAMRIVAYGVNGLRSPDRAMIVITHYQRLLEYIIPDRGGVPSKRGGSSDPATSRWRSSSRTAATPITERTRRDEHAHPQHHCRAGLSPGGRSWPSRRCGAWCSSGSWRAACRIGGWRMALSRAAECRRGRSRRRRLWSERPSRRAAAGWPARLSKGCRG